MRGYLKHKLFEFIPALIIIVWLMFPACKLKNILKNKVGDNTKGFRCEIAKIHGTNVAFIVAILYTCTLTIFFTIMYIKFYELEDTSKLQDILKTKILTVSVASYIPVAAIVANHFSNI